MSIRCLVLFLGVSGWWSRSRYGFWRWRLTLWCPPNCATTRVVEDKNIVIATSPYMLEGFECVHALTVMCTDAYVFIVTPQKDAGSMPLQSFPSGLLVTIKDRLMNPLLQSSGGRLLRMMLHSWWGQFNSRLTFKHWLAGLDLTNLGCTT